MRPRGRPSVSLRRALEGAQRAMQPLTFPSAIREEPDNAKVANHVADAADGKPADSTDSKRGASPGQDVRLDRILSTTHAWSQPPEDIALFEGTANDPEWGSEEVLRAPPGFRRALLRARMYVWEVLEHPEHSWLGLSITAVIILAILASITSFVLSGTPSITSQPATRAKWNTAFAATEITTVAIFTTEIALRFWASKNRLRFWITPMNILDVVSVLPFYVEKALSGNSHNASTVLRILRLARIFRLFKVSRYSIGIIIFTRALLKSSNALFALVVYLVMGTIISASLFFLVETGSYDASIGAYVIHGEVTQVQSIPDAFYWAITTMSTVGYGDIVPHTGLGKLIAGVTMIAGLLVLSLPMTVIGANFADEMQELQEMKELELLAAQQQDGDVLGVGSDMLTAGMAAAVGKPYNGGAGVQGPGWGSGDGSVRRGLAAAAAALEAAEASGRGREGSGSGVREGAGEGRGEGRGGRKGGVQFRSGELARGSGSSGGDKALRIPVGRDEEEQISLLDAMDGDDDGGDATKAVAPLSTQPPSDAEDAYVSDSDGARTPSSDGGGGGRGREGWGGSGEVGSPAMGRREGSRAPSIAPSMAPSVATRGVSGAGGGAGAGRAVGRAESERGPTSTRGPGEVARETGVLHRGSLGDRPGQAAVGPSDPSISSAYVGMREGSGGVSVTESKGTPSKTPSLRARMAARGPPTEDHSAVQQLQMELRAIRLANEIQETMDRLQGLMAEHTEVVGKLQEQRRMSRRMRTFVSKMQTTRIRRPQEGERGSHTEGPPPATRPTSRHASEAVV